MEKSQREIRGTFKECLVCSTVFKTKPSHYERRKYCSYKCYDLARKETLRGGNNPCWRGGDPKCIDCGLEITKYRTRCVGCYRDQNKGENHYNWQGGITNELVRLRNSKEYKSWRESVFERDNYTCQDCGRVGGALNADHIKPFAYYPELRFALENGRTLCKPCHEKTPTYLSGVFKFKPSCVA